MKPEAFESAGTLFLKTGRAAELTRSILDQQSEVLGCLAKGEDRTTYRATDRRRSWQDVVDYWVTPSTARNRSVILFLCISVLTCGCATSGVLDDPVAGGQLDVEVNQDPSMLIIRDVGLIVRGGPGSWVKEANWDEYRVSIRNSSTDKVLLTGAGLHSEFGVTQSSTTDMEDLELKTSETISLMKHLGTGLLIGGIPSAIAVATAGGFAATLNAAAAVAAVVPVAIVAGGVVYMHNRGQRKQDRLTMQETIRQRSMVFPRELLPNEEITGSLFFGVTPSPDRLFLHYTANGIDGELDLHLQGLKDLHLKEPELEKKARKAGPSLPR